MNSRNSLTMLALLVASAAKAQMPGAPVLQNAWAAPGSVVALDVGGGSGTGTSRGSTFAGAAAWAPAGGRFQLSIGAGMNSASGSSSRAVYGVRAALPLKEMMGGNLGIAAFIGAGGGARSVTDSLRATAIVPVGLAIGYRWAVGAGGRGFSLYADPNYQYQSGPKNKKGYFRVGAGLDAGITPRFGLTAGLESGATAAPGFVGPHGTQFGLGASIKLGR